MLELTDTQETALRSIVESLGPALSNAMSESIGRLSLVDDPILEERSLSDLMSDGEIAIQTNWLMSALGGDEVLMVLPSINALELAAVVSGSATSELDLTEDVLRNLTPAMQGIAQGFGIALGTSTNSPIQATNISCAAQPISIGAGIVTAGAALVIQIAYHVQDGPDGTLSIYLSPQTASALADAAAGASLGGMDAGLDGGSTSRDADPAGLSPGGATFGGGPVSSATGAGPLMQSGNPFQAFEAFGAAQETVPRSMDLIMDIPLDVSVELGRVQMLIKDVLELATGSIVELERVAGEPVDLLVNGQLIAKGEVVVIEDNFGIRITEIISPADRLHGVSKRAA